MGEPTTERAVDESVDQLIARVARRLDRAGIVANLAAMFVRCRGAVRALVAAAEPVIVAPADGGRDR